jgi:hypothetical protein
MQSKLVSRRAEVIHQLKILSQRERVGIRDDKKKRQLTAILLQLERDIQSIGFSPEEIEKNEFSYHADKVEVSKQHLIMPPSWHDKKS